MPEVRATTDELIGAMAVEDEGFPAVERESIARRPCRRSRSIGIVTVRFLEPEGHEALAGTDTGQKFCLPGIAAADVDRGTANPDAGEQRAGPERSPRLFRDHAQPLVAELQPAIGLRKRNARPAELHHCLPGVPVESLRGILVTQPAQLRDGQIVGAKIPGRVLEHVLLVVEYHRHGIGNPLSVPGERRSAEPKMKSDSKGFVTLAPHLAPRRGSQRHSPNIAPRAAMIAPDFALLRVLERSPQPGSARGYPSQKQEHSRSYAGGSMCAQKGKRQARARPAQLVTGTTLVDLKAIKKKPTVFVNTTSGLRSQDAHPVATPVTPAIRFEPSTRRLLGYFQAFACPTKRGGHACTPRNFAGRRTEMNRNRILLVEDERDVAELVASHVADLCDEVVVAHDGHQGMHLATTTNWTLIILDLTLPGPDGLSICRAVRRARIYQPIMMLASHASERDRVLGLESGADDYLSKPFSVLELAARVRAIIRRVKSLRVSAVADDHSMRLINAGALTIDPTRREVHKDGQSVELTVREFDLLEHFARHPGRVFKRDDLLNSVWGYGHEGYEHTVNSHINRLRAKIENEPSHPEFIITVWGVGYKFAQKPSASP